MQFDVLRLLLTKTNNQLGKTVPTIWSLPLVPGVRRLQSTTCDSGRRVSQKYVQRSPQGTSQEWLRSEIKNFQRGTRFGIKIHNISGPYCKQPCLYERGAVVVRLSALLMLRTMLRLLAVFLRSCSSFSTVFFESFHCETSLPLRFITEIPCAQKGAAKSDESEPTTHARCVQQPRQQRLQACQPLHNVLLTWYL